MPMRPYFRRAARLRALPVVVRWAGAIFLVALSFALRMAMFGATAEAPFLFFFPAIILSAVFLDRGSGFVATFVSAGLSLYYFLVPVRSFALERPADAVNLALFCGVGCFVAFLIESLHAAYSEVEKAHDVEVRLRRQRDTLLEELRHRIKNDLGRLSAAIGLRALHASPETVEALQETSGRIQLMARLHDRLHHRDGEATIDMKAFLGDIVGDLRATLDGLPPVDLVLAAEPLMLPVGSAGSIGLVVNELITNALKHAFCKSGRRSAIRVTLQRRGEHIVVAVEDNGGGFSSDAAPGTGMRLVQALAAQLQGELKTTDSGGGTRHELRLPADA